MIDFKPLSPEPDDLVFSDPTKVVGMRPIF